MNDPLFLADLREVVRDFNPIHDGVADFEADLHVGDVEKFRAC
jgi:hypothetical protein